MSSERFGVPQTRKRAILLASLDCQPQPPEATHQAYVPGQPARHGEPDLFGPGLLPWVSMAQALGWGMTERPGMTFAPGTATGGPDVTGGGSGARRSVERERTRGAWLDAVDPDDIAVEVQRSAGSGPRCPRKGSESSPAIRGGAGGGCGPNLSVSFVANNQANAAIRNADEPAPTITGGHDTAERQWVARFGNQEHSAERALDEPAATLRYGQRANACDWVQTNNFTAVARDSDGKRSKAGSVPYVRPTDEPSPTVTSRTDLWQVGRDPENVVLDRRQTHGDGTPVGPRAATDPAPTMSAQGLAKGRDVWRESSEDPDAYWNRDDLSERKRTAAGTWPHEQPAPTVVGGRRSKDGMIVGRQLPPGEDQSRGGWSDVPADDSRRISEPGHHDEKVSGSQQKNAVRVSVMEAAILQSFPPWPWQGSKTAVYQQIGNAIPPLMARRVIRAARGVPQATP